MMISEPSTITHYPRCWFSGTLERAVLETLAGLFRRPECVSANLLVYETYKKSQWKTV